LLEDVPTGLIPLVELGHAAGVEAPTLEGLVDRARSVLGGDRWQRPRTLEALGLESFDPLTIRGYVERGFVSSFGRSLLGRQRTPGRKRRMEYA
jgi:opine dehydrogenase